MAGGDFDDFSKRIDKVAAALQKDIDAFVKSVVVEVATNIAGRTPVDEGVARSNWITSLSGSPRSPIKAYSPYFARRKGGPGGTISEGRNLAAVRQQALVAVSAYKSDSPIYISNDTDYIAYLNQGTSRQAPAGFVQAGISIGIKAAISKFKFENTEKV